jgi:hypothetical protein
MFRQTTDHLLERQHAPQSEPSPHQTPLYILMTPEKDSGNILTLPGGIIPRGIRNSAASIADNAAHIISKYKIDFDADEGGEDDDNPTPSAWVHDSESRQFGQARLIVAANLDSLPDHDDFTGSRRYDMIPAKPQPETYPKLELHPHTALLARIQSLNYRRTQLNERRDSIDQLPLRKAEEAILRSFGRYLLDQSAR